MNILPIQGSLKTDALEERRKLFVRRIADAQYLTPQLEWTASPHQACPFSDLEGAVQYCHERGLEGVEVVCSGGGESGIIFGLKVRRASPQDQNDSGPQPRAPQ